MDVEILARIQFALTIMFHYIYPPLSIGLGLIMVIIETLYMKTKRPLYKQMAKFWTKVFSLTFAIGVATGVVMEFEFGTNWATYSRYVGDVFGSALAAEGVFAFFLESGFLAILLFGWNRVGPKLHYFSTIMVCLGAHFSAVWIVIANSWMQTPAGYHVVGEGLNARAEIIDFWAMVFNPSSMDRLAHTIIGAWLSAAFLVMSVSAYYILKHRHFAFARKSLGIALSVALASIVLQAATGHSSAQGVAVNQPVKLAAFEGVYDTQPGTPMWLFGIVNTEKQKVEYGIAVPKLLSWLAFGNINTPVKGLNEVPKENRPNVAVVFQTYHLMIAMWVCMAIVASLTAYYWYQKKLFTKRWLLRLIVLSAAFPQIGNQVGWVSAEMGRYPWIVQGLLRVSEGLSRTVTANQIFGSIIMFSFVYALLLVLFIYLLNEKFKHGPSDSDDATPYQHLEEGIKEITEHGQSR